MDFSYSDEQAAAIDLARQILTDHCTPKHLRSLDLAGGDRFDRALRAQLAPAGLLPAGVPQVHGGRGMGLPTIARPRQPGCASARVSPYCPGRPARQSWPRRRCRASER